MAMDRRDFLRAGALAGVAATVPMGLPAWWPGRGLENVMLNGLLVVDVDASRRQGVKIIVPVLFEGRQVRALTVGGRPCRDPRRAERAVRRQARYYGWDAQWTELWACTASADTTRWLAWQAAGEPIPEGTMWEDDFDQLRLAAA